MLVVVAIVVLVSTVATEQAVAEATEWMEEVMPEEEIPVEGIQGMNPKHW